MTPVSFFFFPDVWPGSPGSQHIRTCKKKYRKREKHSDSMNNLLPVVLVLVYTFAPGNRSNVHCNSSHFKTQNGCSNVRLLNTFPLYTLRYRITTVYVVGWAWQAASYPHSCFSFFSPGWGKNKIEKIVSWAED